MKLPEPHISARCGICFSPLTWSLALCEFECYECLVKVVPCSDGKSFKTVFQSTLQVTCGQLPPKLTDRVRYFRKNDVGERVFRTYTYLFKPCALPKGHGSLHYFPYTSTYTEDPVDTGSVPLINEDPLAPPDLGPDPIDPIG